MLKEGEDEDTQYIEGLRLMIETGYYNYQKPSCIHAFANNSPTKLIASFGITNTIVTWIDMCTITNIDYQYITYSYLSMKIDDDEESRT